MRTVVARKTTMVGWGGDIGVRLDLRAGKRLYHLYASVSDDIAILEKGHVVTIGFRRPTINASDRKGK